MTVIHNPSTLTTANLRREIAADIDARLNQAANEASTGKKADPFRDLGSGSVEILSLRSGSIRLDGFMTSNELLGNRLEVMANTLTESRETLQGFLEAGVSFSETQQPIGSVLQESARAAYAQLATLVNTPYQGAQLFAGTENTGPTLQRFDEQNAGTGLSPEDVMAGIVGGGITDAADAAAKAADVATVFDSANTVAPDTNFEATFFNGTPLEAAPGVPSPRQTALIDNGMMVEYGIQANDPAFRTALQGLAMIAAVDPSTITDPGAYEAWVGTAMAAVGDGLQMLEAAETRLGGEQALLSQTVENQQVRATLYERQLGVLEGVDPYEAANRVTLLSTQLEATYAINARLSRLTFLSFM
ncbi:MAG: flagellin [Pseudomonadota bacterium]